MINGPHAMGLMAENNSFLIDRPWTEFYSISPKTTGPESPAS